MYSTKNVLSFIFCAFFAGSIFATETIDRFQIEKVIYDIKGSTKPFPLSIAVAIDKKRVFQNKSLLDTYVNDLTIRFANQRVFETSSITIEYGIVDQNGITPVELTIHTKDTWNIIALPYPKYDSNSGFQLKMKLKDYNFFGSMQVLNGDLNYQIDNDNKSTIAANLDFSIPFRAWNYSWNWANDLSIEFPQDEIPEFNISTGFDVSLPLGLTAVRIGLKQSLAVNDRNSTRIYSDDPYYFKDKLFMDVPFVLRRFEYMGDLSWVPTAAISKNWAFSPIDDSDLKGPELSWGHAFKLGRYDWRGNFRKGVMTSLENTYSYNMHTSDTIDISVKTEIAGFTSFADRIGLNGQFAHFYNFYGDESESAGDKLRGILNSRISTDTAFTLNIDVPVRIMRVNFQEITGVEWTKYIGFEMHASPFLDIALTHDLETGRYYSLSDAWYSGGMEIIVFPMKMRSIYARMSIGFDLVEVVSSGGKLRGTAERDGKPYNEELLIGIGMHY